MKVASGDMVVAFAPASVANVGPCYDIMGYCLDYLGDFVEAKVNESGKLTWSEVKGQYSDSLNSLPKDKNCAYLVANMLWKKHWRRNLHGFGVELTLHKHMPIGSGLGSSAASAVAAGKLMIELLDISLPDEKILDVLIEGEYITSGARHPDNVVPSYFGGFYFMQKHDDPNAFFEKYSIHEIEGGDSLVSVIIKPSQEIATEVGRQLVRDYVKKEYISRSDKDTAAMDIIQLMRVQQSLGIKIILSFMDNDIKSLGESMNNNKLLEKARGDDIKGFKNLKGAAIDAGAYGCTISGAGPSLVCITDDINKGFKIKQALIDVIGEKDHLNWLVSPVNKTGARIIKSTINAELKNGREFHNFGK